MHWFSRKAHASDVSSPTETKGLDTILNIQKVQFDKLFSFAVAPNVPVQPGFQSFATVVWPSFDLKHPANLLSLAGYKSFEGLFMGLVFGGLQPPEKGGQDTFSPEFEANSNGTSGFQDVGPAVVATPGSLNPVVKSRPIVTTAGNYAAQSNKRFAACNVDIT